MKTRELKRIVVIVWIYTLASFSLMPISAKSQQDSTTDATEGKLGTFSGAKPTEYPSWFKESFLEFEEDIAEAAEKNKRVVLMFHQDGCPYCNLLVERNLSQKDIAEYLQNNFDVIALNMWGDREVVSVEGEALTEKEFAAVQKVQFTPTMLFYDETGQRILKLNGYLPPENFILSLKYIAEKNEKSTTYRDYVRSNSVSDGSSKKLIPETFFQSPPYNLTRSDQSTSRPLAVFFEQKQCPNCETLHSKVLVDEETRDLISEFDVVQLDMWSKEELIATSGDSTTARDWAAALGVSFAPTIVLFNSAGQEVIRSEAWFKIFHTQSLFDYVYSESYLSEPSFQRYISARADHLIEQGIDVDIWR